MRIKILSLRFKILVALSLLAGITFSLVSYLTIEHMKHLGKYTIDACSALGKSAVGDSKEALLAEAREELRSLVAGQAQLIDGQLKRVAGQMNLTANLCSRYMKSTQQNHDDLSLYFSLAKPSNLNDYASYHLAGGVPLDSVKDELKRLGRIQPVLKFIQSNNPGSDIVYIGTPSGIFISSPWTAQPADYDPRSRGWYQQASKSESAVWTGPYISSNGNKLTLTCAKAARNSRGEVIAVCAIDVEVESVVKNMMITRLEPQSKAFILDREGNVIVRRDISAAGVNWDQEYRKDNLLRSPDPRISDVARKMAAGKHGVDDLIIPGDSVHFLAYCPITATGWSIGIAVPKKLIISVALNTEQIIQQDTLKHSIFISSYIERSSKIYIAAGFLVLLMIVGAGAFLSAKITAPVLLLKNKAEEIGRGNLELKIELNTGDELEHLAGTFNRMTDDLKSHIANLEETIVSQEKIERELAVSREIQASLLPPASEHFEGSSAVDIVAMMDPAHEVGGDFYDYFMINDATMFFCIGDVSGKGIPAALFMAMTKTLLAHEAKYSMSPAKVLLNVNNVLEKDNDSCMFATVFCGFLDANTGIVTFSNGGHNHPLVCRKDGEFEFMHIAAGVAIGTSLMKENVWKTETLQLNPGDHLFMYSDGITEAMDDQGRQFGEEKLREALNSCKGASINEVIASVREKTRKHAGSEPQSDDITMVNLCYYGKQPNE